MSLTTSSSQVTRASIPISQPCRVGCQKSACTFDLGDRDVRPQGMIVCRVVASALPGLPPASEPDVVARPHVGVQGRRTTGAASRSRRAAQSQPEAPLGLDGPSGVCRASPGPTNDAAGASIGHAEHDSALASSPGGQEVDLPEPVGLGNEMQCPDLRSSCGAWA